MAKNFCIYCGSPLTPGVECACRVGAAPEAETPAYEAYTVPIPASSEPEPVYAEPVPVAPVSPATKPAKFCIYCGAALTPGVECACRSGATVTEAPAYETPAYEAYTEPAPEYTEPEPVVPVSSETKPAKFCTRCGRPLVPGEVCNCAEVVATPSYEVPNPGAVSGGIKTTMRTSDKPSKAPSAPNPFLNVPSDLD